MEVNILRKDFFRGDDVFGRLDAEYALPSMCSPEEAMRKLKGHDLRDIAVEYPGPTISDTYSEASSSFRYVSIDSVDCEDGLTYSDDFLFGKRPSRAKYTVVDGDVLVSNVRPNRNAVCCITKRLDGSLASSGFTLVRTTEGCSPEIVFAFLKTRFGRDQLVRRARGSMYPAVAPRDVFDVWVPRPPAKVRSRIANGVRRALDLHDEFFGLADRQERQLEQYLEPIGAPPSPVHTGRKGIDWTVIRSSLCFGPDSTERCDAEFFRQEYADFDHQCRTVGESFLLGEHYCLSTGSNLGKGEAGIPFVKQAVLTNAGVNWSALVYDVGSYDPPIHDVRAGDVLIACTAHEFYYVGRKVDYVRSVPMDVSTQNAAVADLMICRPKRSKPRRIYGSYVAAFLRHPAGLHQVQRCIRGIRAGHVYNRDLAKIVRIPIPPDDWLKSFEVLAKDAERKRLTAKDVMRDAVMEFSDWIGKQIKT